MVMQILEEEEEEEEEEEMKQSLALQLLPLRPSSSSSELDNNQININHSVVNVNHGGFRSFHIDVNQTPLCEEDNDDDQIIKPYNRDHGDQHDLVLRNTNRAYCFVNSNNMINDLNPDDLVEEDPQRLASSTRKKLRLSKDQSAMLEECFRDHPTLNPKQKNTLAKQLKLRPRQVEVWFQNRRARTKLKQTEVDCEMLKRCCESLGEENRRLIKEVQELRARCSQGRDHMLVATLAICPSCERRTVPTGARGFLPPSCLPQL